MSATPMWRRYLRFRGPDLQGDVDDELAFHVEMRTREFIARGMDPAAARAEAARRFGDVGRFKRECLSEGKRVERRTRWRRALAEVGLDFRYGVRVLRKSPGFTIVAALTIALGVGSTSAIFSALKGVLLDPLPFAGAERLVVPRSTNVATGDDWSVTYLDYGRWREARVFGSVALLQQMSANVAGEGASERLDGVRVTEDFFRTLSVGPVLGRVMQPDDFAEAAPPVAVISYGFWERRFGGARDVVGKTLRIRGSPATIIGVLPRGMEYPTDAELWMPLRGSPATNATWAEPDNFIFSAVARLAPTRSLDATGAELARLARRVEEEYPSMRKGVTVTARPLHEYIVGEELSRSLWLFLGAVGFILLIGCANVANLMMSRAGARTREFAVRSAVGASRWRLVRQLLTESVVLALVGGLLGVLFAVWGVRTLVVMAPEGLPRLGEVRVDRTVLAFATGLSILSALAFGLLPALQAARRPGLAALGEGTARAGSGVRGRRLRNALVVAELALSLILLAGAGLFLRSLDHLRDTDPGFDTEGLLTFAVSLQGDRYDPDEATIATYDQLLERSRAIPGVESAAMVSALPLGGGGFYLGRAFLPEGRPEPPAGAEVSGMWSVVSPGYFRTMGIPLVEGREFTANDDSASVPVMIVNREFARQMFPSGGAVGARVRSWRDENVYREIVGVTDDVRFFGAGDEIRPLAYVPHPQDPWGNMVVAVRVDGATTSVARPLREVVRAIDPDLAMANVQAMDEVLARSVAPRRFGALLLSSFAALALLLATVGIYGVLSYVVSQRTREIGVRMALGADRSRVQGMVIREAAAVVAVALVVGLAGALLLARLIAPLLYGIRAVDPLTLGSVSVILAVVALAASWVPAYRATRVDPIIAMRTD